MSDFLVLEDTAFASALQAEAAERLARAAVKWNRAVLHYDSSELDRGAIRRGYDAMLKAANDFHEALRAYAAYVPEEE